MALHTTHEPDADRYVLHSDGEPAAILDYAVHDGAIYLTRTFTEPALRGRGLAAELVAFAIDDIEATTTLRIVPDCWYVEDWFALHPERSGLLRR